MSAFTFTNKFHVLSLGLSLLSAIVLSFPQPAVSESVTVGEQQNLSPAQEVDPAPPTSNQPVFDRIIPISELPQSVADRILENASQTTGLPISEFQIVNVRQVTWPNGCMGRYRPGSMCTMALVDGWIVTVNSSQQELGGSQRQLFYHASDSQTLLANFIIGDPPPIRIPGSSQNTPILPGIIDNNRFIFRDVPSGRWYDPPTTYGFHFLMTSNSLFTQILDFPVGIDSDNLFAVSVGNKILGEFGPSKSVDFVALLGQGVSEFTITGIDPLVDATNSTAFPVKLAFSTTTADFEMWALEYPQSTSVPEPSSLFSILTFGTFGVSLLLKRQQAK